MTISSTSNESQNNLNTDSTSQIHQFLHRFTSTYVQNQQQQQKTTPGSIQTKSVDQSLEIDTLKKAVTTLAHKLQESQKENLLLNKEHTALKNVLLQKESEIEQLHDLQQRLKSTPQETLPQETFTKMTSRVQTLEGEAHTLRCEKISLQRELGHLSDLYKKESELLEHARRKIEELAFTSSEQENRLQDLESALEATHRAHSEVKKALYTKETEVAQLKTSHAESRRQSSDLALDLQSATQNNSALMQENEILKQTILSKEGILQETCLRLQEIEDVLAQKLEEEIHLHDSLSQYKENEEQLLEKIGVLEKIEAEQLHEIQTQAQKITDLTQDLQFQNEEYISLEELYHKTNEELISLKPILESSLCASDLLKRAIETLNRTQESFFHRPQAQPTSIVTPSTNIPPQTLF